VPDLKPGQPFPRSQASSMGRCRLQLSYLSTTVRSKRPPIRQDGMHEIHTPALRGPIRIGTGHDATQYVSAFELASATEAHQDDRKRRTRLRSSISLRSIPKSADIQTAGGPQTFFARHPTTCAYTARGRPPAASISCSLLPVAATAASSVPPMRVLLLPGGSPTQQCRVADRGH
jgi:hypothetical protein